MYFANAAMGPVEVMVIPPIFWSFVVATLIVETRVLTLAFKEKPFRSFVIVLGANGVTLLLGFLPFCIVGANFLSQRQPFIDLLIVLFGIGTVSALVRAGVWQRYAASGSRSHSLFFKPCLLAHWITACIVLGVAPTQEDAFAPIGERISSQRRAAFTSTIRRNLENHFKQSDLIPNHSDWMRMLASGDDSVLPAPDVEFDRLGRMNEEKPRWWINPNAPGSDKLTVGVIAIGHTKNWAISVESTESGVDVQFGRVR